MRRVSPRTVEGVSRSLAHLTDFDRIDAPVTRYSIPQYTFHKIPISEPHLTFLLMEGAFNSVDKTRQDAIRLPSVLSLAKPHQQKLQRLRDSFGGGNALR